MALISIESSEDFAVVRLNNGLTNALSPELIGEMSQVISLVRKHSRGVVLAGGEKFFSIGFDIPGLLKLDRPCMSEFFHNFNQLVLNILTLPIPTVASVKAHAVAGGSILMFACDYRIAASGKVLVGLNGIKLGVPIPYLADLILRQIVGDQLACEMLYRGEFVDSLYARKKGIVHHVFPKPEVETNSLELVTKIADLPSKAFASAKANRVELIAERYERNFKARNEDFLDCWFSPQAQELLKEATKKF
ncbi:MAG: enoyl-CoA hydratase/isomerase family protein [Deltaproteobacteria bacterium]|nr:enoyl-CoA hydratase/isomerase family protein [Deltaproteobacteria bacterium]